LCRSTLHIERIGVRGIGRMADGPGSAGRNMEIIAWSM
jgi:hypothetical protein